MKIRMIPCLFLLVMSTVTIADQASADAPADKVRASLKNYFKAWGEPDSDKRAELLKTAWSDKGIYTDPTAHVEGRDALVRHIDGFLSDPQFKGASLAQASEFDIHHKVFRFEWELKDANGVTVVGGMDCGEFNDDGAITKIVGFFGPFSKLN